MEPLPPPSAQLVYDDSVDSSPQYRNTESWDEQLGLSSAAPAKLRLMCSYGGHIFPRPTDKSLCYLGGETRIVVVDRNFSLSSLSSKLSQTLLNNQPFSLKYQLPNEDLDSLISVTTDEDLENMIEEYDRISSSSVKPSRLRLFLFPSNVNSSASSIGSLLEDSKSESWFVNALNGAGIRGLSGSGNGNSSSNTINCLLGLEEETLETLPDSGSQKPRVEVHSVPDSPIVGNTSSFGSTSSASFLSNLPPIRVHADEARVGFEDHFSLMSVTAKLENPNPNPNPIPAVVVENPNPNLNRVLSENERSEHSLPGAIRKPPQPPPQSKVDVPATDSVARDNLSTVVSRQKPVFYQDLVPIPTGNRTSPTAATVNLVSDPKRDTSDPNYRIPVQVQDQSYMVALQSDHQQFLPSNPHYIPQQATGPVPISYYQMHPMQHPQQYQQQPLLDQQYPMYFIPVRQNPQYNISLQSNLSDASSIPTVKPTPIANPPPYKDPSPIYPARSAAPAPPKPELAANMYRTAAVTAGQPLANPQLIQYSEQNQQYMGYHPLPHPSQSAAASGNFAYEFMDPLHAQQIYYTQPMSSTMAPQYQTISSAAAMASENLMQPPLDNKQNRT
ncbi:uncharacterized protein LOC143853998 [Tasmannia lanceolata]|uniref:uncharacterized protein LOC143853998 n=1 Tax=Tasmannia lanceolata TaxID=3420 RepID=UPI004064B7ED